MSKLANRFKSSAVRRYVRGAVVHTAGSMSSIGSGIHLLNGHTIGEHGADRFNEQLDALRMAADLVRIEDAVDMITGGFTPRRPAIAFTFDDAFSDWNESIAPVLEAQGVNACFFLNPGLVGLGPDRADEFNHRLGVTGKRSITPDQVHNLARSGHVIGAHTVEHPKLVDLETHVLDEEIVRCRELVSAMSGTECTWFAWPFGGVQHIDEGALRVALDTYALVFSSAQYPAYFGEHPRVLNRRHVEPYWRAREARFFMRKNRY